MQYVMSLSGGLASAIAAERAIVRYGRENVILWFADTSYEDEDLYRFVDDLMARWGGDLITYRDGRNPLQVAEDAKIIPNNRIAPCTRVLKIEPFVRYIKTLPRPLTVMLGLDYTEQHRMARPRATYEALGCIVDYPLTWEPLEARPYTEVVKEWGIDPPRLYGLGFPHNNCGGRCIKQGQREWKRLARTFPERFTEAEDWENAQRAKGGARANHAIMKERVKGETRPLPLDVLRGRVEAEVTLFDEDATEQ